MARLSRWGKAAEDAVLVILLGAMILLAVAQIVMRNGFGGGFIWADETLRLMVLWLALAGSVAAARADKHLAINVLARALPPRGQSAARFITNAFTSGICGLLAWHAWRFLQQSFEFEDTLVGGLPAWWFQVVLPVGFALMCWRYFVFALEDIVAGVRGTRRWPATPGDQAP
ncbi:MAG: TRAP transporter small permease [Pseudomonadota bacterium]